MFFLFLASLLSLKSRCTARQQTVKQQPISHHPAVAPSDEARSAPRRRHAGALRRRRKTLPPLTVTAPLHPPFPLVSHHAVVGQPKHRSTVVGPAASPRCRVAVSGVLIHHTFFDPPSPFRFFPSLSFSRSSSVPGSRSRPCMLGP